MGSCLGEKGLNLGGLFIKRDGKTHAFASAFWSTFSLLA